MRSHSLPATAIGAAVVKNPYYCFACSSSWRRLAVALLFLLTLLVSQPHGTAQTVASSSWQENELSEDHESFPPVVLYNGKSDFEGREILRDFFTTNLMEAVRRREGQTQGQGNTDAAIAVAAAAAAASHADRNGNQEDRDAHDIQDQESRMLQNFDELNQLLQNVTIILPEFSIPAGRFLLVDLTITARYTKCFDISIRDLKVLYERVSNTKVTLDVLVDGLGFDCEIYWRYNWITSGSGVAQLYTTNNSFNLELSVASNNFDLEPPTSVAVSQCAASVQIDDIDASGGFEAFILDAVEGLLRSPIERQVNDVICDEASQLGTLLGDLIQTVDTVIDPLLEAIPGELQDPLYPEKSLNISSQVELIDLSSPDTQVLGMVFDFVNEFLGGVVDDIDSPTGTGQDLAINRIMRNIVLNENRALVLNGTLFGTLFEGEDMLTRSSIAVDSINIYGLDTLTEFIPIQTIGQYTVASSFSWPQLQVGVVLDVEVSPSEAQDSVIDGGQGTVRELMEVAIGIEGTDIDLAFMFAVGKLNVTDLSFGSFFDLQSIVSCLTSAIYDIEISNLSVVVENVIPPTLDGFISSGIDEVVSSLSLAFFEMYEATLLNIVSRLFQVEIRKQLNDLIDSAINDAEKCNYLSNESDAALNIPDMMLAPADAVSVGGSGTSPYGNLFPLVLDTIVDEVEKALANGMIDLNEIIRNATVAQSGYEGKLFFESFVDLDTNIEFGSLSFGLQLKVYNTSFENLDTFGLPLNLLSPSGPHSIENIVAFGVGAKQLKAKTNVMFGIAAPGSPASRNDLEISIGMKNLILNMVLYVLFVEKKILNLPLKSMTNLNCLLSTLSTPRLDETGYRTDENRTLFFEQISLAAENNNLGLKCNFCSSSDIRLLVSLFGAASAFVDLSGIINSALDFLTGVIRGERFQTSIDRYIASTPYMCPSDQAFNASYTMPQFSSLEQFSTVPEPANNFFRDFAIILMVLVAGLIGIIMIVRRRRSKQTTRWLKSATAKELAVEKGKIDYARRTDEKLNTETSSIFCSKVVPISLRLLIPLIIIGNIALFLSGHLSLGAQVDLIIDIAGDTLTVPKVFDFSLGGSVRDMWENGAKELAIFIAIFSGIWPYTKQIITFVLWFAPTRWVSVKRRGSTLLWLDALGKWSFVDIFVLIISLVGFRIIVRSPEIPLLSSGLYSIDLLVVPKWGLYANMIAQIVSQISSHFIIYCHRKVISESLKDEAAVNDDDLGERSALCKHSFRAYGPKHGIPKKSIHVLIVGWAALTVGIFICGYILKIFTIESFGLIGIAIEAGQNFEAAIESFSFFGILKLILRQANFTKLTSDYAGLGSLCIVFVWTVLVVPLLQLTLLLYRWFVPMNRKGRHVNFVMLETIMAWQYTEVFILSVVIGAWQLGPISEYMVNDYCGELNEFFLSVVSLGILDNLDGQCFRAEGSVNIGGWFLAFGAIFLAAITQIINRAAMQQVEEEEWKILENQPIDILEQETDSSTVKYPEHVFTDYFAWTLRNEQGDRKSVV